jgi:hypothetical protein
MTRLLLPRLRQFAHSRNGWDEWAYLGHHSKICQGTLPDMPQPADFGRFYFDLASIGILCCDVRDMPTPANRLEAEL